MAPEVMLEGRQSKAADVYAYGITLWELFTGGTAFGERARTRHTGRLTATASAAVRMSDCPLCWLEAVLVCSLLSVPHPPNRRPTHPCIDLSHAEGVPRVLLGSRIIDGLRPTFPPGTPAEFVKLAGSCWDQSADNRCASVCVGGGGHTQLTHLPR